MDKNSIIGFVLIGAILFGFTFYSSKQAEKQQAWQAYQDSIARAEQLVQMQADSAAYAQLHANDTLAQAAPVATQAVAVYRDSLLEAASGAEGQVLKLENEKLAVAFTTKGAQPLSVRVKDYTNYDRSDLYIFHEGQSEMGYIIYAGENINTKDFVFTVAEQTDSSLVMRLPFAGGGYIQQRYVLHKDSYMLDHALSFIGMENVIPRNVSVYDFSWKVTVPRMEKGYKNEVQYSKGAYYQSGDKKPVEIARGRSASKRVESRLSWFTFHQQFFSAIMQSKKEFASGDLTVNFLPEEDPDHNLMACEANMRSDFRPGETVTDEYSFYFGPNSYRILKSYDQNYEKTIPLGGSVVGLFTKYVIIPLFNFLHRFIASYGLIILLMTLFIKIVVLPFAFKSYSSSAKMQAIKPEIDKLNEKYPRQEDAMKKQQETMALYQKAGINPMGGCLPMLLQFPILFAMFRFFPASIELRQQPFLWAEDLSAYDSILDFGTRIPLLGDHISLFAVLMAVSMFFFSKFTMQGQTSGNDPNAASMRFMSLYMMPIMMFFVCNNLSSGLSYYYLLSNLISMVETWVIKKWFVNPAEIQAKLKASAGKPAPKSKWQQRLEEAQKMQRQMQQEQQKKGRR
ncbi:MAG: membrane protein insertase YidC [Bacteroidales bacterium]|nr:membrane protein insertase YidC [Bacteroidales bacterium]